MKFISVCMRTRRTRPKFWWMRISLSSATWYIQTETFLRWVFWRSFGCLKLLRNEIQIYNQPQVWNFALVLIRFQVHVDHFWHTVLHVTCLMADGHWPLTSIAIVHKAITAHTTDECTHHIHWELVLPSGQQLPELYIVSYKSMVRLRLVRDDGVSGDRGQPSNWACPQAIHPCAAVLPSPCSAHG